MVAMNWIFSPISTSRFMTMRKPVIVDKSAGAAPQALGVHPEGPEFIAPPALITSPRQGFSAVVYSTVMSEDGTAVVTGAWPGSCLIDWKDQLVEFSCGRQEDPRACEAAGPTPTSPL